MLEFVGCGGGALYSTPGTPAGNIALRAPVTGGFFSSNKSKSAQAAAKIGSARIVIRKKFLACIFARLLCRRIRFRGRIYAVRDQRMHTLRAIFQGGRRCRIGNQLGENRARRIALARAEAGETENFFRGVTEWRSRHAEIFNSLLDLGNGRGIDEQQRRPYPRKIA